MAIPTTLSGAEMTRVHRQAAGAPAGSGNVRPAVVVNDPGLSASQPEPELAASALNALGHAAEGPCTPRANPVSTLAALEAARLLVGAWPRNGGPDRDALALGALLAGYTIDSTVYGLHHVLSQTLVRLAGIGHGPANAIMLPHTLGALAWRFPAWIERLGEAMGGDPSELAAALCGRTGATRLAELGAGPAELDACADAAAERPELDLTPPRADRAELRALYGDAL
jgi:alcohol dehydrogenase class IV